jgi:nitrogen fixation NifU-like protein
MGDLRELYQEMILDHGKRPRNFRKLDEPNCSAEGHNPLCGDRFTVYLDVKDGVVKDVSFQGGGCAISTASASMMTESLKGKKLAEVQEVFKKFHKLLTSGNEGGDEVVDLGKLAVFSGVREFPVRVKCATLAWHTLRAALEDSSGTVSTE